MGYHYNNDGIALDLNLNGGMMGSGDPFTFLNFEGLGTLTNGPGNRGLDFNNDTDFRNVLASIRDDSSGDGRVIDQANNYSNLWVGTFTPNANGNWGFRNAGDDDRAGIWFDIDQDGVFESSTPGLGSNRGEQLSWEDGGWKTVNGLVSGQEYMIAFTHREGGGGSRADFRFRGPGIAGEPIIKPADATQAAAGYWNFVDTVPTTVADDVIVASTGPSISANGVTTLNNLTFNVPGQLNVGGTGVYDGGAVDFSGNTSLAGDTTLALTGRPVLTLRNVSETGAAALTLTGDGTVFLPTASTHTGVTTVGNGTVLEIRNGNALGSTAAGTVVDSGGSLRLAGANFTLNEPLTLNGGGTPLSDGALHGVGNNQDVNGRITLGSNATIRKEGGGDMEFRGGSGGIDLNGFELRMEAVNTVRLFNNGLIGNGTLRKEENGTLEIRTNSPTFSGTVNIANGFVDVNNQASPFGSANVSVFGDGTLRLRDGVTIPNNITINTDGEGTNGAIRSENNSNTITGNVTVAGRSRVHVNNTLLTVTGQVTGNIIDKYGTGTLSLTHAGNSFADLNLNQGSLRIANAGALGGMTSVTLGGGQALEFDGTMAINALTITPAGGVLRGLSGTTTINTPIGLGGIADLLIDGPGDIVINTPFGNGHLAPPTGRFVQVKNNGTANRRMDIGEIEAFAFGTTPTVDNAGDNQFLNPTIDLAYTTNGASNYAQGADSGFTQPHGTNTVNLINARETDGGGTWSSQGVGNYVTIDLGATFGVGSVRVHQRNGCCQDRLRDFSVNIFDDNGSGAPGALSASQSYPGQPPNERFGELAFAINNNVIKSGTGTLTLTAANTYNGLTDIQGGTLIAANSSALGTTDAGTTVANGATLGLRGGITIPAAETITLGSSTIANIGGANTIPGPIALGGNFTTVDSRAGSITLSSPIDMAASNLTLTGAGGTVIDGAISGTVLTPGTATAGLLTGDLSGNMSFAANPGNQGVRLSPDMGLTNGKPPWTDSRTWVYTGQFHDADGTFSFGENIDDIAWMTVDSVVVLNNGSWNTPTTTGILNAGMGPAGDGWHDVEIRFSNGNGGAGAVAGNNWTTTKGFGLNINGTASNQGNQYNDSVTDPGDASLWRLAPPSPASDLIKTGPGTANLNGDNTYVGITDVQQGTLLVNGTTSGQGAYTVRNGATLGGVGTIGGDVNVESGGILGPGLSKGEITIGPGQLLTMEGGSIYEWEIGVDGAVNDM
ncbi:autotransporter-associated beta strand repeat-containing protein, partial [bacterium]|nr:autotransporter-associated beta strand repeat-containing protein [bacterium]